SALENSVEGNIAGGEALGQFAQVRWPCTRYMTATLGYGTCTFPYCDLAVGSWQLAVGSWHY
ncbi:hypothetical protein VOLCADRAFT_65445, partial [Volvox carteri f. nagariensis]